VAHLPVRRTGGKCRQDGGSHFQEHDLHVREAGTNLGTITWATAVAYATGRRSDLTWLGQPALTPEGATMATDASDREQQQQELEEIRRQFAEVGERMGSAFEPAAPDEDHKRPLALAPPTARPDEQPARPRWQWVAVVAAIFLLGTGLGYTLPRAAANDPAPSTARPPVSTQAPRAPTVASVPKVCLEMARRGDQTVHLFTVNDRSRRLALALKAYTVASQACRSAASP
jgi:hypothetical protein